ncbi:hypothetical protein B0H14DRAFT_2766607, partial [Mycena olivaceomarginata]
IRIALARAPSPNHLSIDEYLVKIRHFPYTQRRISPTPYPPTLGPSERLTLPLIFTSLHTSFLFCSILNLAVTIILLANRQLCATCLIPILYYCFTIVLLSLGSGRLLY